MCLIMSWLELSLRELILRGLIFIKSEVNLNCFMFG